MSSLIVRQAIEAFKREDYALAIQLYEKIASIIGAQFFRANIEICNKRMSAISKEVSLEKVQGEIFPRIVLSNSPEWQRISVSPGEIIEVDAVIQVNDGNSKSGVALIRFFDKKENLIDYKNIPLSKSAELGANFSYLSDSSGESKEIFRVKAPISAVAFEVGFRLFKAAKKTTVYVENVKIKKSLDVNKRDFNGLKEGKKTPAEIKVALIADEFTFNSFKDEFIAIPVEPENWRKEFEKNKPDLFFCESAWSGPDPVRRPWKTKVYASNRFSWENRKELLAIIDYCRSENIPTIFWNKEDPSHYEDRINDFVKTATLFDHVFTSAAECVARYKDDYGLKSVYPLPFATNPKLFNPIDNTPRSNKVVFAGSWYATHPERCVAMENMLDQLTENGFEVEIYDRYYGSDDPNRIWPSRFQSYIKPSVPHEEMPAVYKSSYLGLNFNTVTDSSTMFARRVFELMSCNTMVISNYSRGVDEMFGSLVVFADRNLNRLVNLKHDEVNKIRENALNLVLREHTYRRRWEQILDYVGIKYVKPDEALTVMSLVRSREDALNGIIWFQRYSYLLPNPKLLLVVDETVQEIDVANFYEEFNRLGISVTSVSHAKKYALEGRYSPVESAYFLLIDPSLPPPVEWIKKACLHSQYMVSHLLSPVADGIKKYSVGVLEKQSFLLGVKSLAANFLSVACKPKDVYYI